MPSERYVLITPARNEESYIEKTIQALISQTIFPKKWMIVSDGSTDRTDDIVTKYACKYEFIQLVRMPHDGYRNFGSKVSSIDAGYSLLKNTRYNFIGILDADVSFGFDYFERVLERFKQNPKLGIGGGIILELHNGQFKRLNYNLNSVAGAVQFFRKKCYKDIGGYIPLKHGGIDAVAEVMARMYDWEVKTFSEIQVYHHRRIGVTKGKVLKSKYRYGVRENIIGTHPMFLVLKSIDRFRKKPYFVGGILMMIGYLFSWLRRDNRPIPYEVIRHNRKEEKRRLRHSFQRTVKLLYHYKEDCD